MTDHKQDGLPGIPGYDPNLGVVRLPHPEDLIREALPDLPGYVRRMFVNRKS